MKLRKRTNRKPGESIPAYKPPLPVERTERLLIEQIWSRTVSIEKRRGSHRNRWQLLSEEINCIERPLNETYSHHSFLVSFVTCSIYSFHDMVKQRGTSTTVVLSIKPYQVHGKSERMQIGAMESNRGTCRSLQKKRVDAKESKRQQLRYVQNH